MKTKVKMSPATQEIVKAIDSRTEEIKDEASRLTAARAALRAVPEAPTPERRRGRPPGARTRTRRATA